MSALFKNVLDSWKSAVIRLSSYDHAIYRYVEVNTNENFFPFQSTSLTVNLAI